MRNSRHRAAARIAAVELERHLWSEPAPERCHAMLHRNPTALLVLTMLGSLGAQAVRTQETVASRGGILIGQSPEPPQ